jgi:glycerol-3-phosphate acyltransferase PlsX
MVRIAVDGMGGDFAPLAVAKAAESVARDGLAEIHLVGDEKKLASLTRSHERVRIVHAPTSVGMDEAPSSALRKKKDSSISRAFQLLKEKKVDAVVSAGNSGAVLAFAIFTLGRLRGVERPSIAALHPNAKGGITVVLDSGGNVDCKPSHLAQFALMGDAFARCALGKESPRIGVLSNAEEETKGNELTREANALIKGLGLDYVGYMEGTDIHNGRVDVVVCDGFVGNVALKTTEGVVDAVVHFLKDSAGRSGMKKIGYLLMKEAFDELARKTHYSEIGGAPLLGVDGVTIICHGKSNEKAIRSAIVLAQRFVERGLNESIKETMLTYEHFRG